MSVILTNIDMPKFCGGCPFAKPLDNATCMCEWKPAEPAVPYVQEKPEWCPLEHEEHKTGKWEVQPSNKEQGERDFIWWKCSECGQVIFSESEHDRKEFHKYCGRCGAKMT